MAKPILIIGARAAAGRAGLFGAGGKQEAYYFEGLEEAIKAIEEVADNAKPDGIEEEVAEKIRKRIYDRTLAGRDVEGKAFAPYSAAYRNWLAATGAGSTGKVDLYFTGGMLESMSARGEKDKGVVYFASSRGEELMLYHMRGEGGLPQRQFFAVSDEDVEELMKKMEDHLEEVFNRAE